MMTHQDYLRISFIGMSLSKLLTKKSLSRNKCQPIMSFSRQVWLVLTLKHMKPMISMMSLITIRNYCGNAAFVSKQSERIQDLKH